MQDFITALKEQIKAQITILFHHKTDGRMQQMADASYTMYLTSITVNEPTVVLLLSNGMDGDAKSDMTVLFPTNAIFTKKNDTAWQIEYETPTKTQIVRILLTPKLTAKSSQVEIEKPSIKEFRNSQGKLARLYIETPEEGVSLGYLHKIKAVLEQILTSWSSIIVATENQEIEFAGESVTFRAVELLTIPGNTFFELQVGTANGERTLEVATTLTIDLEKSKITFSLEEIQYEISKAV